MKTLTITLTQDWQQVADASGIVTLQGLTGLTLVHVGDAAPTEASAPALRLGAGKEMTLSADTLAWVRGKGSLIAVTV